MAPIKTKLIKLAWIGAQGSAKTTTVNRISRMLTDIGIPHRVVIEKARVCSLPLGTYKAQEWMVHEQIRDEQTMENQLRNTILANTWPQVFELCDRSIWDSLIYMTYMNRHGTATDSELHSIDSLINGYVSTMVPYNELYLCEPRTLYPDPKRPSDDEGKKYQLEIYDIFKEIIKERGLKATIV